MEGEVLVILRVHVSAYLRSFSSRSRLPGRTCLPTRMLFPLSPDPRPEIALPRDSRVIYRRLLPSQGREMKETCRTSTVTISDKF